MPDITMCTNEACPLSYSCWSFNCPPSQYQQSYAKFEPKIDEVLDEVECKMHLETPQKRKPDIKQRVSILKQPFTHRRRRTHARGR